jgi:hypothetical protein
MPFIFRIGSLEIKSIIEFLLFPSLNCPFGLFMSATKKIIKIFNL